MSETVVNKPVEAEVIPASDCVVETTSGRVHAKSKMSVGELTSIGLMTAILIVMSFTPLGYFRTLGLSISLMMIPVAIGAMIIGPSRAVAGTCLWRNQLLSGTDSTQRFHQRIVQHQPPVYLPGMRTYPCAYGMAHRCFVPADP